MKINYFDYLKEGHIQFSAKEIELANSVIYSISLAASLLHNTTLIIDIINHRITFHAGSSYLMADISITDGKTTLEEFSKSLTDRSRYLINSVLKELSQKQILYTKDKNIPILTKLNLRFVNSNIQRTSFCKMTLLHNKEDGVPWLYICNLSVPECGDIENAEILLNDNLGWKFNMNLNRFIQFKPNEEHKIYNNLNDKEKEVIILSAQGFTTKEIADRIHLSYDAIKSRKKNIMSKLSVSNMNEAMTVIINRHLL
jgi:two-component response regulator